MPHKPSQRSNNAVRFVSVSLTVELKPQLAAWVAQNRQDFEGLIERAVMQGYRLSVKEEAEGFAASMAYVREKGPNQGLVLVERGSTPTRALLRLLWAHNDHYKLVWPQEKVAPEDDW